MPKSNVAKIADDTAIDYRHASVFIRRIGAVEKTGYEGQVDATVYYPVTIDELLELDIPYHWEPVSFRGELPDGVTLPEDAKEKRYEDERYNVLQTALDSLVDREYRTRQAVSKDKLVAGFQAELTSEGQLDTVEKLIDWIIASRQPIKRGPSPRRALITALKSFVLEFCQAKSLDADVRSFVYTAIDTPHMLDSTQRIQLDNWLRQFQASVAWKAEYQPIVDSSLNKIDEIMSLRDVIGESEY